MKWVAVKDELPQKKQRVLVGVHANTEWPIKAVGTYCGDHWLVDGYMRPVNLNEVQYWASIARLPGESLDRPCP